MTQKDEENLAEYLQILADIGMIADFEDDADEYVFDKKTGRFNYKPMRS
jgi:hypothetical protein